MELEAISRIRYHSCRTAKDGAKVNAGYVGYEAAKWALLVRAFDWLQWIVQEHENRARTYCLGPMSDDGEWELTGYEIIDWKEPDFVGQHGYISHDINEVKKNWISVSSSSTLEIIRQKCLNTLPGMRHIRFGLCVLERQKRVNLDILKKW